ncbi:MAG: D-glycerate dehydrogenase [Chloroflexi bacterium]|nr:D-glycerate dehydrogenase [Chloroflexota bacterium]
MAEHKVFVTRRHIVPDAIAFLEQHFDVDVWEERDAPSKEILRQKAAECEGFLTEITDIVDRKFLDAATALKVVANRAVGMDNIDIPEATRHGVLVSNTPGVLHESCADFALGLMLSLARNITYGDRQVRAHEWKIFDQMPYLGTDVHGATLGIVGLGLIGTAVARRAMGFDMRVLYHSRTRKPEAERDLGVEWVADLDSLLAESDFVSLHLPLTPETRHVIGERELKLMKPGAFLINASRGGTVDPRALYAALSQGVIAGAALDVTEPEPIPFDDPLLSLPNIVFTPHISSASTATVRKMGMMAADNIRAALTGDEMPSCVNPEAVSG